MYIYIYTHTHVYTHILDIYTLYRIFTNLLRTNLNEKCKNVCDYSLMRNRSGVRKVGWGGGAGKIPKT